MLVLSLYLSPPILPPSSLTQSSLHFTSLPSLPPSLPPSLKQAISLMEELPKTFSVYSLLGKIQFKASHFQEASENFKHAAKLLVRKQYFIYPVTCVELVLNHPRC